MGRDVVIWPRRPRGRGVKGLQVSEGRSWLVPLTGRWPGLPPDGTGREVWPRARGGCRAFGMALQRGRGWRRTSGGQKSRDSHPSRGRELRGRGERGSLWLQGTGRRADLAGGAPGVRREAGEGGVTHGTEKSGGRSQQCSEGWGAAWPGRG